MLETTNQTLTLSDILGEPLSESEAMALMQDDDTTYAIFNDMKEHDQQSILSFIQGKHGLKICYDPFFQKIFSAEEHPERLESLLSSLMNETVKIKSVLPREGIRLSEEGSIVIMDILIERVDGSLVDCEMQKIGYYFPGQRSCCYESDMIMRQYNRLKNELKDKFTYERMKPVFLIVLMEQSSKEFKAVAPAYIHRTQQSIDTGANVAFLANTTYISLDTFHDVVQNIDNNISKENYQNAWLTFLSADEPTDIINLCTALPEFREYYRDIMEFRRHPKELIYMYSKSLAETDMNTQRYMFQDMQKQIDEARSQLDDIHNQLNDVHSQLDDAHSQLNVAHSQLDDAHNQLDDAHSQLDDNAKTISALQGEKSALLELLKSNGIAIPSELNENH